MSSIGNYQDAFFSQSAPAQVVPIARGEGPFVFTDDGRRLLDACSGPFLCGLGQGDERVLAAMVAQGRRLTYSYSKTTRHQANFELARRLSALAGPRFERVYVTTGGSEANEAAIKMLRALAVARGEHARCRVISLNPGYHGATLHTLGLNGDVTFNQQWGPLTVESVKIPAPLTFRATSPESAAEESLAYLESAVSQLGPDSVLAFIMEPVGGQASGANVPHPSFARGARALCDRHGIALVFDEVVSAFRTGHNFAFQHDPAARPDFVTLAKGLGAGFAPVGAVLTSQEFVDSLAATGGLSPSLSYDAAPLPCAAGAAVLAVIEEDGLVVHAARIGQTLRAGLDRLRDRSEIVADVRGRGCLLAIEIVADKSRNTKFPEDVDPGAVAVRCGLDHGLLLYSRRQNRGRFGDWLLIAPPLNLSEPLANELVDRLEATVNATADVVLRR